MTNQLPKPPKLPGGRRHDEVFNPKKLFVGGLSKDTTQKEFREYWEKWGSLEDCVVMVDPSTQKSRGFGFVVFSSQSIASEVLNRSDSLTMHGRKLDIKKAVPRSNKGDYNRQTTGGGATGTGTGTGIGAGTGGVTSTSGGSSGSSSGNDYYSSTYQVPPPPPPPHHPYNNPYINTIPTNNYPYQTRGVYTTYPPTSYRGIRNDYNRERDKGRRDRGTRERGRGRRRRTDKLFVGGLAESFTDDTLNDYFKKYGDVQDAVVMFDKEGNSRRFGFVTFVNPDNANVVLNDGKHIINGVKVTIERAIPKDQIGGNSRRDRGRSRDRVRSRSRSRSRERDRIYSSYPYSPYNPRDRRYAPRYDDDRYAHYRPPPPHPSTMYHRGPPPPPVYSPPHAYSAYTHTAQHIRPTATTATAAVYGTTPAHMRPTYYGATAATATATSTAPRYKYDYVQYQQSIAAASAAANASTAKGIVKKSVKTIKPASIIPKTENKTVVPVAVIKPEIIPKPHAHGIGVKSELKTVTTATHIKPTITTATSLPYTYSYSYTHPSYQYAAYAHPRYQYPHKSIPGATTATPVTATTTPTTTATTTAATARTGAVVTQIHPSTQYAYNAYGVRATRTYPYS